MARIRVNTEDLKTKAKDFDSAADAFNRAGDDILAAALAMPSYDGQLSGPARKAGYEIQTQFREIKAALSSDAEFLRKKARAYEDVDSQTVDAISQNQESLLSCGNLFPEFDPIYSRGDSYMGYNWDPNNPDVMIICMYGVCRKVARTEENSEAFDNFRDDIDDYLAQKKAFGELWIESLEISAGIVGVIIAPVAGAALFTLIPKHIKNMQDTDTTLKLWVDATHKAANDWNLLTGDSLDGYPGDYRLYYEPYISKPGAGTDVYEPPDVGYTPPDNSVLDASNTSPETGQYQ